MRPRQKPIFETHYNLCHAPGDVLVRIGVQDPLWWVAQHIFGDSQVRAEQHGDHFALIWAE
jgi:hypothetical protein